MYGIREDESTGVNVPFTVWAGAFASEYVGSGILRPGAGRTTVTLDYGHRVRVSFPDGITAPRTADNYQAIDAAISDALARAGA